MPGHPQHPQAGEVRQGRDGLDDIVVHAGHATGVCDGVEKENLTDTQLPVGISIDADGFVDTSKQVVGLELHVQPNFRISPA